MSDGILTLSDATFDESIGGADTAVIVDFWAEWCGPCKMIAPVLEDIAKEHDGKIQVAKLNVDDNPNVARRFDVMSIPTLLVFADGEVKKRLVGAKGKAQLLEELAEFIGWFDARPWLVTGPLLRSGDRGEAVRDVQQRLIAAGLSVSVDGTYDARTEQAVRAFQARRRIRVDGICGPETWAALIESGYELGDRLLYLCQPMLRGDDVAELQRRLNALGFDAGREDGILGPDTESAIGSFQRDTGIASDKVAGPATLDALGRVGSLAGGSVANVRERELLRRQSRTLDGLRVYIAGDFGIAALSAAVATGLRQRGAVVGLDTSESDPSVVAATANRFEAEAFVALTIGSEPGARCAYFANQTFRSEGGFCLATRLTDSLRVVLPVDEPIGRTYRLLRETRMAAVVCELVGRDDAEAMAALTTRLPIATKAIVDGIRRGVEEPVDAAR